jgi:hypothetical protein
MAKALQKHTWHVFLSCEATETSVNVFQGNLIYTAMLLVMPFHTSQIDNLPANNRSSINYAYPVKVMQEKTNRNDIRWRFLMNWSWLNYIVVNRWGQVEMTNQYFYKNFNSTTAGSQPSYINWPPIFIRMHSHNHHIYQCHLNPLLDGWSSNVAVLIILAYLLPKVQWNMLP